ncbi:DNA cytosine methyltransferase [Paenibacillus sp. MCAF9]|uniref:DNA cytosine methyltransferase n=1 Tax=Paenibacillus sp. MCAF9 TaxID=3233046 RepID=UPI003F963876
MSGFTVMSDKKLVVAGLFSGIGGFELGFKKAGFQTSFLCELDKVAREVLKDKFPGTELLQDVREVESIPSNVDVLCAGFPCQNLSSVGQKEGIEGGQSSLVNEVFRILRQRPVEWVIIENVAFMLKLKAGEAMNTIMTQLEELGYSWAYRIIDSSAYLPQRRKRVYIVASLNHDPRSVILSDDFSNSISPTVDTFDVPMGFYWTEGKYAVGLAKNAIPPIKAGSTIGIPSPPAILYPDGTAVTPDIRDAERLQGFEADWTKAAELISRPSARWKLVGNAVTVDVITWIANKILEPNSYDYSTDTHMSTKVWANAGWSIGGERFEANVSDRPVSGFEIGIDKFLRYEPKPLSYKASRGFIKRAKEGNLRFPPNFIELLESHMRHMEVG